MRLWLTLLKRFANIARRKPRIVLDTNVLVSATLAETGFSAAILRAARAGRIQLVVSPYILSEYSAVMRRRHISKKYQGIQDRVDALIRFLSVRSMLVTGEPVEPAIFADPKDDAILACATQGSASYIVSGDAHLLDLATYRGIRILAPRDFAEQILQKTTGSRASSR